MQEIINYRLPRNIEPMHYNVTLDADLKDSTEAISMIGNVYMEFRALENTTNITLNYNQLDIKQDLLTIHDMSSGAVVDITSTESIPGCDSDFFVIYTDVLVKNNVYILSVPYFNATLRSDNAGLYIAKYFDENNVERSFLVTQFSAIGARKTFPCLDEPAMKATFTISLIRGAEYTSLSNGDLNFTEYVLVYLPTKVKKNSNSSFGLAVCLDSNKPSTNLNTKYFVFFCNYFYFFACKSIF